MKNKVNIDYGIQCITIDGRTVELSECSTNPQSNTKIMINKEQQKLKTLIEKFNPKEEIGKFNGFKHKILLKSEPVIRVKNYQTPLNLIIKGNEMLNSLLKNNIIRKSSSLYCSPAFLIPKKNGNLRLVVDYSKLNSRKIEGLPMLKSRRLLN
ncbi:Transposon Tf2-6 polyprotein [Dictyocoela muelleri]|nr:Transposon Tf2-6 polyprotein [Dictyocoela muelleri]